MLILQRLPQVAQNKQAQATIRLIKYSTRVQSMLTPLPPQNTTGEIQFQTVVILWVKMTGEPNKFNLKRR